MSYNIIGEYSPPPPKTTLQNKLTQIEHFNQPTQISATHPINGNRSNSRYNSDSTLQHYEHFQVPEQTPKITFNINTQLPLIIKLDQVIKLKPSIIENMISTNLIMNIPKSTSMPPMPTLSSVPKSTSIPPMTTTLSSVPKSTTMPPMPTLSYVPKSTSIPPMTPTLSSVPKSTTMPPMTPTLSSVPKSTTMPPMATLSSVPKSTTMPPMPTLSYVPKSTSMPPMPTLSSVPKSTTMPPMPTLSYVPKSTSIPPMATTLSSVPKPTSIQRAPTILSNVPKSTSRKPVASTTSAPSTPSAPSTTPSITLLASALLKNIPTLYNIGNISQILYTIKLIHYSTFHTSNVSIKLVLNITYNEHSLLEIILMEDIINNNNNNIQNINYNNNSYYITLQEILTKIKTNDKNSKILRQKCPSQDCDTFIMQNSIYNIYLHINSLYETLHINELTVDIL